MYIDHYTSMQPVYLLQKPSLLVRGTSKLRVWAALTAALISVSSAEDVPVPVPNGDFEAAANSGSTGGSGLLGLVGPNTSVLPLAGGPWGGTTQGILGLISPPRITISANGGSNGNCRISGLVGLKLLGLPLLNTHAVISQTLAAKTEPYVVYTLEADVQRSAVLDAALLAQDGVGIGLTINGKEVASSLTSPGHLLSIQIQSSTSCHVTLKYATTLSTPDGSLGIRLFTGEGGGLLHAGVLADVIFDNISLTAFKLEA